MRNEELAWKAARPPGFLEYLDALGPEAPLGAWLRSLPVITRVDDVAFMHGGIDPDFLERFPVRTLPSYERLIDRDALLAATAIENDESTLEMLRSLGYIQ